MNVEPQTYGLPDWSFPSPTATPKSTVSHQPPFQSPKGDSPSHFADAFCTPRITGPQTPVQTPLYSNYIVSSGPESARNTPLTPDDPRFHINHFSRSNHLPLPPVNQSNRLSSSPDPQGSSSTLQRNLSVPRGRTEAQMDQFQMQTPPPTRDSSSRRGLNQGEYVNQQAQPQPQFQHVQHMAQGPTSTPARALQQNIQSPQLQTPLQYPGWQFSPEMYQFHNAPASAPAMPQSRFSWEQSPQISSFQQGMMHAGQSPFGTSNPIPPELHNWPLQNPSPIEMQGSFSQPGPLQVNPIQDAGFWTSGDAMGQPASESFSQDDSYIHPTSGVNPNLIFSFSSPPQTIDPSSVKPQFHLSPSELNPRQPYEQQTRASNREREQAKLARQPHQQSRASASLSGNNRPGLQRSNTDSGFRRSKPRSADSRLSGGLENIPRKPSPLKRNSQASLSSIPETVRSLRPRTRLVVDENGTARTVTLADEDDISIGSRQSFGRWGDDEDSSEDDPIITSQRNSFVVPSDIPRTLKHARAESDHDGFEISKRPLSSNSLSSLTSRLGVTPLGHKMANDPGRRYSQESFGGSFTAELDLEHSSQETLLADQEEAGDAQNALKRLVEGRLRRDHSDPNATIKPRRAATNPVRSSSAMDITNFQSPPSPSAKPTSSIHTPTTDRSSRSTDSTRCVCANYDNGDAMMIQCESCANWLHVRCVFGKRAEHRGAKLPGRYVCSFCTGQIRAPVEPSGSAGFYGDDSGSGFAASPLGYKSGYRG